MASIAKNILKSTLNQTQGKRMVSTYAAQSQQDSNRFRKKLIKGEFVPVYVVLGMIVLQMSIGLHTVKQQLKYSPSVRVSKKWRETIPEVEDPDYVVSESDNFIKNSYFRKIAHVQEFDKQYRGNVPDSIRGDAYAHEPKVETLKSVGVDLKSKV